MNNNNTTSSAIWAITLIIVVVLLGWFIFYSGVLNKPAKRNIDVDVNISTPVR